MEGKNLIAVKFLIAIVILMAFVVSMEAKAYCCPQFPGLCCPNPCCASLKKLGYTASGISPGMKLPFGAYFVDN